MSPDAISVARWRQPARWWRCYYVRGGHRVHAGYVRGVTHREAVAATALAHRIVKHTPAGYKVTVSRKPERRGFNPNTHTDG